MKILFCIKSMTNQGGGAERVLATVANGLHACGHDVGVATFDTPGGQTFYALDPGLGRMHLGIGSTTGRATVSSTLRRMLALRRQMRDAAPDVVVGFMHSMFIPLGLALWRTGIPMVASEHIVPEHYESRPLERVLLGLTPHLATRITCVSEGVKPLFPPAIRDRMVAVPNPVTVTPGGPADVAGTGRPRKTVLAVGRLDPQKDPQTLITAFASIARDVPDWDLRIVGDGDLRPDLERLVARLGLVDRILLPGATRDVTAEYQAAQVFVAPSRYESFGLTTAEALAHGLPAVGFADCPGTNDLISHGHNGILVEAGHDRPAALARSLRPLMCDTAYRVGLAPKTLGVPDAHRPETVIKAWEQLLLNVVT
jgi:glycosyltransferase involved in cell wall biosynthesis